MKKQRTATSNYISDLIKLNPTLGLTTAHAIEASTTLDQALACARFSKVLNQLDIETSVRAAYFALSTGLPAEAQYQYVSKVATAAINDYTKALLQDAAYSGKNFLNTYHKA